MDALNVLFWLLAAAVLGYAVWDRFLKAPKVTPPAPGTAATPIAVGTPDLHDVAVGYHEAELARRERHAKTAKAVAAIVADAPKEVKP